MNTSRREIAGFHKPWVYNWWSTGEWVGPAQLIAKFSQSLRTLSWRYSQNQTCRQTTSVLISRSYTILGGTHKWASRWCNRLTTELPHKKHSGRPVCRIYQIGKSHGSERWRVSKPYSCVFFSSSLRTCLSTSKLRRLYLLLKDARIHTFDLESVRKTRSRWSGGNRYIHSFCDLLDFTE